jgi:hypothetical protein
MGLSLGIREPSQIYGVVFLESLKPGISYSKKMKKVRLQRNVNPTLPLLIRKINQLNPEGRPFRLI